MASDTIEIQPTGPLHGAIRPPGSKSITNRALICAALADGVSMLRGALASEDTQVMVAALGQLGIRIEWDTAAHSMQVHGCGGKIPASQGDLYVANSGTTVRFLASLLALGHGNYRLHGTPRMHQRPIEDLREALRQLKVDARSELESGCPPVCIEAKGLAGGAAAVRGDVSSQFLSGLLMAAPYAERAIELTVEGELVSQPYIRMTLAVMAAFGVDVRETDLRQFRIPNHTYQGRDYHIEPDASAASYFFGAAAVTGGEITVEGLSKQSLQGDVAFVDVLQQMGCQVRYEANRISVVGRPLSGIEVDMNAISDTVQTLGAVAMFAQGPTVVTGVGHIRHKETDRLAALATELRKLGAQVDEQPDGLRIVPGTPRPATIDTYDDHRMAMSLALVGLVQPGVVINDPGCTAKTYPEFFTDLSRLAGTR